jgi:hypothetical protein
LPDVDARLLSPEDLIRVTGAKRYSKQRRWFKDQFGIEVPRRANGSVVMTWATFEGLLRKKHGLPLEPVPAPKRPVQLHFD